MTVLPLLSSSTPNWLTEFPDVLRLFGLAFIIALAPFALVLMTSFTRITIVLSFLKQALATSVPSNTLIVGLSLILTIFIMHPVLDEIQHQAVAPYLQGDFKKEGAEELVAKAWPPLRDFMLFHTREKDLELFIDLGGFSLPSSPSKSDLDNLPWYYIVPSFVLSELRMAFMMGFLLFLPFLVIDMVVTSILMSMGMIMLPPVMISFPFKLLLFVVVDGWRLVLQQIAGGYNL